MTGQLPIVGRIGSLIREWAGNAYSHEVAVVDGGVNLKRNGLTMHFPGGVIDRPIGREDWTPAVHTIDEVTRKGQVGIWVPASANGTEPS